MKRCGIMSREQKLLKDFLTSPFRLNWLITPRMQVYVRKAKRLINGQYVTTLDVASITVEKPGKGTGTKYLNYVHKINPFEYTYVESVLNERFDSWLERHGWVPMPGIYPRNFYKKVGPE